MRKVAVDQCVAPAYVDRHTMSISLGVWGACGANDEPAKQGSEGSLRHLA